MQKLTFNEAVVLEIAPARTLSNRALSERIFRLAKCEAEMTVAFLLDLMEYSMRGLHIEEGYPTLFSYVTQHLKIPKSSAYLRIQSMKVLKEIPELKQAILDGTLTMSAMAMVQSFLEKAERERKKNEKNISKIDSKSSSENYPKSHEKNELKKGDDTKFSVTPASSIQGNGVQNELIHAVGATEAQGEKGKIDLETKKNLFDQVIGKSSRETEALLAGLNPTLEGAAPEKPKMIEREKALAQGHKRLTLVADPELVSLMERLKEVISHRNPDPSYVELLKLACKETLIKLDPHERAKRALARKEKKRQESSETETEKFEEWNEGLSGGVESGENENLGSAQNQNSVSDSQAVLSKERSRSIPAEVVHEVWAGAEDGCQNVNTATGKRCGSRRFLQIQHDRAYGKDGDHRVENLKIYCYSCNQKAAISDYGPNHMKVFLMK